MEAPRRKLLLKSKPKHIQQKTMMSVHKVLKERGLCRAQAFLNAEGKAPERKSNLKRKTASVENKPADSTNEVMKKRRLMNNVQNRAPTQQNPERKLAKQKPSFIEKPTTWAHREGRSSETRNQQEKNVNAEICFKSTEKADNKKRKLALWINQKPITLVNRDERLAKTTNQKEEVVNAETCLKGHKNAEEKKRVLHDGKKITIDRERQKQREAARLVLHQVNNTCGFEDNMQSMRDFEKLLACTGNAFVLTVDNYCFRV